MEKITDSYKSKVINNVSIITILLNVVLSVGKFIAGIVGNSSAMIADAFHSMSDVLTTIIVIIGNHIANKKADEGHPYGHERFECIASFILAFILMEAGIVTLSGALKSISEKTVEVPSSIALYAGIASILVKGWMFIYTYSNGKKVNSSLLKADAVHHLSDCFSSIAAIIGIVASQLGYEYGDALAGAVIAVILMNVAFGIIRDSSDKMVDKSCPKEFVNKVKNEILDVNGVKQVSSLKTRIFADKVYVDVEIDVDENLSLKDAHSIAEDVHSTIEKLNGNVKHCMVHVNPYENI